jgi:hypothetical protein
MSRPWHRHRLRAALWCLPNLADAMSLVQHAAARAMPRGPVAHIAEHFTIAGKKLLAVHAKWIGRLRPARRQTTAWVSPIHLGDASTAAA